MAPKTTDEGDPDDPATVEYVELLLDLVNALKRVLDPPPKPGDRKSHKRAFARLAGVLGPIVGTERVQWMMDLGLLLHELDQGIVGERLKELMTPAPVQNKSLESRKWRAPVCAALAVECLLQYGYKRRDAFKQIAEIPEVEALLLARSRTDPPKPLSTLTTWWSDLKYKRMKNKHALGVFEQGLRDIEALPRKDLRLIANALGYVQECAARAS
jgi:hypothetical protein